MIGGLHCRVRMCSATALCLTFATVLLAACSSDSSEEPENRPVPGPTVAARSRLASQGVQVENIGQSVQGRQIEALTIGRGDRTAVVIGGIHTGTESETVDLVSN